jgi:ubiquinone/menaquinone biosynthesis C-methylase UbiE
MSGEPWYARRFDATYLEVYAHRDEEEARRATAALLAPLGLRGRSALDLACGPGRYLRALQAQGARVVGLDLSLDLLHAARRSGLDGALGLVCADMLRLPFRSACFDLVLSMFTSFGYFATEADDRSMLGEVARVLRPGGDLVLDFLNAERLRRELVAETQGRRGRFEVHERRWVDTERDLVVKEIELRDGGERRTYREQVRLWSADALVQALAQVGLVVRQRWGDYGGAPFQAAQSERLVVHAQRLPAA